MATEYRFTVGVQYARKAHPSMPHAHPDGWLAVHASTQDEARALAVALLGREWAFDYAPEQWQAGDWDRLYPAGPFHTITSTPGGASETTAETWTSETDGRPVVQIDTRYEPNERGLRVYVNDALVSGTEPTETETHVCRHCGHGIVLGGGAWIAPDATGDDSIWRETCPDNHTEISAPHEPAPLETCGTCGEAITSVTDGEWLDINGSAYCETRVSGCGACDDGESHPHAPAPHPDDGMTAEDIAEQVAADAEDDRLLRKYGG